MIRARANLFDRAFPTEIENGFCSLPCAKGRGIRRIICVLTESIHHDSRQTKSAILQDFNWTRLSRRTTAACLMLDEAAGIPLFQGVSTMPS